jgi:hypothetical protein
MSSKHVDIWSNGEVVSYLNYLLEKGQVKKCSKLEVNQGYARAYYPKCVEKWASREKALNVKTSTTGYGAPSNYYWPRCPDDCPKFEQTADFISSLSGKKIEELILIKEEFATASKTFDVFIIHGHNKEATFELEKILKEKFHLNPVILVYEPGKGRTLIEKFEQEGAHCSFAFAIMTPDDLVKVEGGFYTQARPNVIFELGWFYGKIGRNQTCILLKEGTEIHSDLDGISRIVFRDSITDKYLEIESELKSAGLIKKV